jgi:hypothetical protein
MTESEPIDMPLPVLEGPRQKALFRCFACLFFACVNPLPEGTDDFLGLLYAGNVELRLLPVIVVSLAVSADGVQDGAIALVSGFPLLVFEHQGRPGTLGKDYLVEFLDKKYPVFLVIYRDIIDIGRHENVPLLQTETMLPYPEGEHACIERYNGSFPKAI